MSDTAGQVSDETLAELRLVLRDRAKRHWRNYNGGRWGRGRGNAPDRS